MPVVKSREACWPCFSVAAPRVCSSPLPSLSRFLTPADGRRQLHNDLDPSERGLWVPSPASALLQQQLSLRSAAEDLGLVGV